MRKTIAINGWSDMAQFGINALTGEACAFGMRLLCDLNEDGVALISEFLGAYAMELPSNYNTKVAEKDAVRSCMLPRSAWKDLASFAVWKAGALALHETPDGGITAIFDEVYVAKYAEMFELQKSPVKTCGPRTGSRMEHLATGRIF